MSSQNHLTKLLLASPRGFCAGVRRAIEALNSALKTYPCQTIYCYHQIVHNTLVVKDFEKRGVKFVNNIEGVPDSSILVFSSHGVSPSIRQQTIRKKLKTIDATCPFVNKTHLEVKKYATEGRKIIYIGHKSHDEAVGTTGEAPEASFIIESAADIPDIPYSTDSQVALITQTTLSVDETEMLKQQLRQKFPNLIEPPKIDICMATQNRQNGVKDLVKQGAQLVVALGSPNSSNSNKLKGVAEKAGAKAVLLEEIADLDLASLKNINCIGLTAGASLPEEKISEAVKWFKSQGIQEVAEVSVADESRINLPPVQL